MSVVIVDTLNSTFDHSNIFQAGMVTESKYSSVGDADEAKAQLRAIRNAAMDLLARREHSEQELRRKLLKKFGDTNGLEQVIAALNDDKLLSDRRFAESYTRYRSRAGFGPRRIALELAQRGVGDVLVREAMMDAQCDWFESALRELTKKFGHPDVSELKLRARVNQFLYYRGFSSEHIEHALNETSNVSV